MPNRIRTTSWLLLSLLVLAFAWVSPSGVLFAASPAKNVLFIVADDLRDAIGCYGHPLAKTPNIDRLAARGVRFERAYVQYTVCNPSRSSFLSGLRPDETGVYDNATILRAQFPEVVTFPQQMKELGWHTAQYGKIFHLGGGRKVAERQRFVDLGTSWDIAVDFQATPLGKKMLAGRNLTDGKLNWCAWGMADGSDRDQPDGQIAEAVREAIVKQGDRPWMIGAGFMKPHDPFIAPKQYFDLHPLESLTLHRDPQDQTQAPPLAVGFGAFGEAFHRFHDVERREFLRAYLAGTSFMDAQLGHLLDLLDRENRWSDTVVIFIGDHGYHLGEREWWNKNTLFERSCRSPLVIAAPGVAPGVAKGLVEFVDLYPTIAELCGFSPPKGLSGQSLVPMLREPAAPGKEAAFTLVRRGVGERGDSIRTDRWRYTAWSDGAKELYDHHHDPQESYNVAERYPEVVSQLQGQLSAHLKQQSRKAR